MVDVAGVAFGAFLVVSGALTAINHPVIDEFNRWMKAAGTTQRPSQIEMSDASVLIGRVGGTLVALIGAVLVLEGVA